jgi:general secretion pathway protein G
VDHLAKVKTSLGMFEVDVGRYPTTQEGLGALITRPADVSEANWRGPYNFTPEDLTAKGLKDPWGHELVYRCPGVHNPDTYDLYSVGPDGKEGTDDDIGNWAKPSD